MSATIFYYQNDMILRLTGLTDANGDPVENATVQLTALEDCDGETPGGIVLPLTMNHTSDGNYEAAIDSDLEVEPGDVLTGTVVATAAAGVGTWYEQIVVRRRTA